jgi:hypothetical protein
MVVATEPIIINMDSSDTYLIPKNRLLHLQQNVLAYTFKDFRSMQILFFLKKTSKI